MTLIVCRFFCINKTFKATVYNITINYLLKLVKIYIEEEIKMIIKVYEFVILVYYIGAYRIKSELENLSLKYLY